MEKKREATGRWKVTLPLILGLLFAAPAIEEAGEVWKLLQQGDSVAGVVIGIDKIRSKSSGQPVVEFFTRQGERVKKTFNDPVGGSYRIGERVSVLHDPERPLTARIATPYGLYTLLVLPLLLALSSWGVAAWFFLERRHSAPRQGAVAATHP